MSRSGTRISAAEILIQLDRDARTPLRRQLEQQLRELIRTGALAAGAALPSSRVLGVELGVSRRLVVETYEQLAAEGYLTSAERSTTRVAVVAGAAGDPSSSPEVPSPRYDMRTGVPALAEFPRAAWLRALTAAIRHAPDASLGYPDPRGAAVLRQAVADYLRRVRAVAAHPERVVITAGFTQAVALLTAALADSGTGPVVALEDPGLPRRDATVAAAGGRAIPVPVDDHGIRVDLLPPGADAVIVTPAHQFPLGIALTPARRAELLDWARGGRLIVEDDYDAEFRYDREPIGAMQGLDPEHVAYVGTVSKTLSPALRLGWMVLPTGLVDRVAELKRAFDGGSPTLDQLALARLIDSGGYERHLHRVRHAYRARRDELVAAVRQQLPLARIGGLAAGLHLVVELPEHIDVPALMDAAGEHDLAITDVARHYANSIDDNRIILNYANIRPGLIDDAVRVLAAAVREVRNSTPTTGAEPAG